MNLRRTFLFGLGVLACIASLVYLYLNVPPDFPQPPFWSPRPRHSFEVSQLYNALSVLPRVSISTTAFHWLNLTLLVLSFGSYAGAIRYAPDGRFPRRFVLLSAVLLLLLVIMPPLFATDVFYYAISGQIAGEFRANPYLQAPADFPQSALLPYNYWVDITTPYGPVWTLLATLLTTLTRADPLLTTLLFKGLGAVAVAASAYLIWRITSEISPRIAPRATLLFLWNPVVLLEAVANAHNDVLMAVLTLAAAFLLLRGKSVQGFVALIVAVFVKYLVAPVAALYFLARLRSRTPAGSARQRALTSMILLSMLVSVLLWLPFWEGSQTLSSLARESGRGMSGPLALIVVDVGLLLGSEQQAAIAAGMVSLMTLMGVGAWLLQRTLWLGRRGAVATINAEMRVWAYTLFLLPIALPRAHPWFLIPALALFAAVYGQDRRGAIAAYVITAIWFVWRVSLW